MNTTLLKSAMVANGDTQETLADALGLSLSRLNAKINERDGAAFTLPEIQKIVSRYHLSSDEATGIFFASSVN